MYLSEGLLLVPHESVQSPFVFYTISVTGVFESSVGASRSNSRRNGVGGGGRLKSRATRRVQHSGGIYRSYILGQGSAEFGQYLLELHPHPFDRSLSTGVTGGTVVYRHPQPLAQFFHHLRCELSPSIAPDEWRHLEGHLEFQQLAAYPYGIVRLQWLRKQELACSTHRNQRPWYGLAMHA